MSIVSTVVQPDNHLQKDGRRYVTERHTDHTGVEHLHVYKAADGANYQAAADARKALIEQNLAETEFENLVTGEWRPLVHQTEVQFAARLRARYKAASGVECARLAKWIMDGIDGGSFTATQVRNAFGLTAGQWTTLSAKLTTLRSNYNAALAAQGE